MAYTKRQWGSTTSLRRSNGESSILLGCYPKDDHRKARSSSQLPRLAMSFRATRTIVALPLIRHPGSLPRLGPSVP